jgi:hypothetical protein
MCIYYLFSTTYLYTAEYKNNEYKNMKKKERERERGRERERERERETKMRQEISSTKKVRDRLALEIRAKI